MVFFLLHLLIVRSMVAHLGTMYLSVDKFQEFVSFLLPCGSQGRHSEPQAWWQTPLPTEASHQPSWPSFLLSLAKFKLTRGASNSVNTSDHFPTQGLLLLLLITSFRFWSTRGEAEDGEARIKELSLQGC